MILLRMTSCMPTSRARWFCRRPFLKIASLRFGYIAVLFQRESGLLAVGGIRSPVARFGQSIRADEYHAHQFFCVQMGRNALQGIAFGLARSHNHQVTIACRRDKVKRKVSPHQAMSSFQVSDASSSGAGVSGVPADITKRLGFSVGMIESWKEALPPRTSARPAPAGRPSKRDNSALRKSASINRMGVSWSCAQQRPRFRVVTVLPSPGVALLTAMERKPFDACNRSNRVRSVRYASVAW